MLSLAKIIGGFILLIMIAASESNRVRPFPLRALMNRFRLVNEGNCSLTVATPLQQTAVRWRKDFARNCFESFLGFGFVAALSSHCSLHPCAAIPILARIARQGRRTECHTVTHHILCGIIATTTIFTFRRRLRIARAARHSSDVAVSS